MSEVITAKVRVNEIKKGEHHETFEAFPVYSNDPNDPNKSFSDATPSGKVELYITNKKAFGFFVPGKEYLVTFTPAEAPVPESDPAPQPEAPTPATA